MQDLTVLVADDEQLLRRLLDRILTGAGCRVLQAADGDEALRIFGESPKVIDAVILDATMPPAGAAAVLEALLGQRPEVAVVLTSGAALEPRAAAMLVRCRGTFVRKPFAPDELMTALHEVLSD